MNVKILRVTLINFSRVFSGLGKTKITIDFTNTDQYINILVGENGSGKSSIMSCFHPFAFNNAIGDTTSNSKLIMDNKDGKKIIDILCDDTVYHIEHNYLRKKDGTISVKSFISENGEELNDSGLSSTFKTIIYDKIGIDETFLTLLSIGNKITGFVEYTSGERKKYAGKIFQELGVFDEHYKNLTSLERSMKTLLNNVTSKLSKYGNVCKEDIRSEIDTMKRNLDSVQLKRTSIIQTIGGYKNQLAVTQSIIDEYDEKQSKLQDIINCLDYNKRKITTSLTVNELDKEIKITSKNVSELDKSVQLITQSIKDQMNRKELLQNELSRTTEHRNRIQTDTDIVELTELEANIQKKLNELSSYNYDGIEKLDKTTMIRASIYLDELKNICKELTFDIVNTELIVDTFRKYQKDSSLYKKMENRYNELGNSVRQYSVINNTRILTETIDHDCNCDNKGNCAYYNFYQKYLSIIYQSEDKTSQDIRELQSKLNQTEDILHMLNIFDKCYKFINTNKQWFEHIPVNIFNPKEFIIQYMDSREIYNNEQLTKVIDMLEKADNFQRLQSDLHSVKEKIQYYEDNKDITLSMDETIKTIESDMRELEVSEKEDRELLLAKQTEYNDSLTKLDNLTAQRETVIEISELQIKLSECTDSIRKMESSISEIRELQSNLEQKQLELHDIDRTIATITSEIQDKTFTLTNLEHLEKEELEIHLQYDDIKEIRNAVSPTKGIPVEFIEFVVKEEMIEKINELLEPVYHGRLQLLNGDYVKIDEKDFLLPYKKGNTIVSDISEASDGEKAILTIAFSLVLIQMSLHKYNIMLLDEIDTALDVHSRAKFIELIETFVEKIDASQIFLITHNNMFDAYPVNVIMTSPMNISNFSNANVLKLYEQNVV